MYKNRSQEAKCHFTLTGGNFLHHSINTVLLTQCWCIAFKLIRASQSFSPETLQARARVKLLLILTTSLQGQKMWIGISTRMTANTCTLFPLLSKELQVKILLEACRIAVKNTDIRTASIVLMGTYTLPHLPNIDMSAVRSRPLTISLRVVKTYMIKAPGFELICPVSRLWPRRNWQGMLRSWLGGIM